MYLINEYPTAHAFLVKCSQDAGMNQQILKIYGDALQKIEARLDKELVIDKDIKTGEQIGIGTKRPVEEYILNIDIDPLITLAKKDGTSDTDCIFLKGHMYANLINVIIGRILPTLASKRMPPADPSGMLANLFNGKMPEA